MDAFSYVSVLLSIIIGLAVTQVLTGVRGYMLTRARIHPFWPTQVWAGILIAVSVQTWWAMFALRGRSVWDFPSFAVLLLQTIVLYLRTGLVYPDFHEERTTDLREHYFQQRRNFFTLLTIAPIVSICRDLVLHHDLPHRVNLGFHLLFIAVGVSGLVVLREWYHKVLSVFFAIAYSAYVIWLFTRLE